MPAVEQQEMPQPPTVTAWVQRLSDENMLVISLALVVAAAVMLVLALLNRRAFRHMTQVPRPSVAQMGEGQCLIEGQLEPLDREKPLRAPFSAKRCSWYRATIDREAWYTRQRDWDRIFDEADPRPCRLSDETGTCLVLPRLADSRAGLSTACWHSSSWTDSTDGPLHVEAIRNASPRLRFCEERLPIVRGYALGYATVIQPGEEDGESLADVLGRWRTDYLKEVKGRPDKHPANPDPIPAAEKDDPEGAKNRWSSEAPVMDRPSRHAAARSAVAHGMQGPIKVIGPDTSGSEPFTVGGGRPSDHMERVQKAMHKQAVGAGLAAVALGALILARLGLLGF